MLHLHQYYEKDITSEYDKGILTFSYSYTPLPPCYLTTILLIWQYF